MGKVTDQQATPERKPPEPERPSRRPGALRGRIALAPDFDVLPADILAAMEGAADDGAA